MQYYNETETGNRIKNLRMKDGMPQEELAQKQTINFDRLGRNERGHKGMSIDVAITIATEFQVSLDYLLLGKTQQTDLLKKEFYELINSMERIAEKL